MPALLNSTPRIAHEFPLAHSLFNQHGSVETTVRSQVASRGRELVQDIERLARELSAGRRLNSQTALPRVFSDATMQRIVIHNSTDSEEIARRRQVELRGQLSSLSGQRASMSRAPPDQIPTSREPNISVRDHGSRLPEITYREQHEQEFERSLEYVHVQRKILKALWKNDTVLAARDAYKWTKAIVPQGQQPEPLQALRLCYYMRSLGYDTFANITSIYDASTLCLLVVNPESETRGLDHDHLYWVQDISSGHVMSKPYTLLREETYDSTRRHPLLTVPDLGGSFRAAMAAQIRER
ncbi:hypothetical protein EJ07DRAFT_154759 [Lizonia empirigonia]|nr:hypothetical protein EJ07DRAFT_154759 [Lizonia empirigonia]